MWSTLCNLPLVFLSLTSGPNAIYKHLAFIALILHWFNYLYWTKWWNFIVKSQYSYDLQWYGEKDEQGQKPRSMNDLSTAISYKLWTPLTVCVFYFGWKFQINVRIYTFILGKPPSIFRKANFIAGFPNW